MSEKEPSFIDPKASVEAKISAGEVDPADAKAAYAAEYATQFSDPAEAALAAENIHNEYDAAQAKGLVNEQGMVMGAPTYETDKDRALAMAEAMDGAETTLARARQAAKRIDELSAEKEDASFLGKMKLDKQIKGVNEDAPFDVNDIEAWSAAQEGSAKRAVEAAAAYDAQKEAEEKAVASAAPEVPQS